mgnify:CR=1 FL=1
MNLPVIIRFFILFTLSLFSISLLSSCGWIESLFTSKKSQFDPCDPGYNYYDEGGHYIHDEMVNDDGTFNYEKLLQSIDPEYSRCDPMNPQNPISNSTNPGTP